MAQVQFAQTLVPYKAGDEVYFGHAPRNTVAELIEAQIAMWGRLASDRDAMIWKIENRGDASVLIEPVGHPYEFARI